MSEVSNDGLTKVLDDKGRQVEILKKRAALLAASRVDEKVPESRLVVFRLGEDRFGVDLEAVRVVNMVRRLTPLPGVPRIFAGLLAVRGGHITAIDLVQFLESGVSVSSRHLADATKAVVVGPVGSEIAILVEELEGILDLFSGDVRPIKGANERTPILNLAPGGIQIIDVPVLLADSRLQATRGAK